MKRIYPAIHPSALALLLLCAAVTGCASNTPVASSACAPGADDCPPAEDAHSLSAGDAAHRIETADKAAAAELRRLKHDDLRNAYEQGARDTIEEFKAQMRARQGFVYEPSIVEWVEQPAGVRNGAYYPRRTEPMIQSPGRWIEYNGVLVPDAEVSHE